MDRVTRPEPEASDRGVRRRTLVQQVAALGAAAVLGRCGVPTVTSPTTLRVYRIGWLSQSPAALDSANRYPMARQALRDLGYVEGQKLLIEFRHAVGSPERLPELATELVNLRVDLLLTATSNPTLAAKRATSTIPIVFFALADPVGLGIVPSLSRQGGNITGVASPGVETEAKRLELLKETVPSLASIAVLFNGTDGGQRLRVQAAQAAARALGVGRVDPIATNTPAELDAALEALAGRLPDGLVDINPSSLYGPNFTGLGKLLDFTVKHRLPHMCPTREMARAGGLMGLAADAEANARNIARVIDKVLRGAKPADVPIEVNSVFIFALNLSMARKIGLTFPESVMRQATEIIQ